MGLLTYLKTIFRFREFVRQAVIRDLKIRYKRSALGVIWSVLNPLLLMIVMSIAFALFIRFNIPHYPLFLISGLLVWQFFNSSSVDCLYSLIHGNYAIYSKVYVPKAIFVIASTSSLFVNMLFAFLSTFVLMFYFGTPISPALLSLPLALILLYGFVLGISMLISLGNVFFRDMQYVIPVALTALFYLTPVFYDPALVPEKYSLFVKLNPMYFFIELVRGPIYRGEMASGTTWMITTACSFGIVTFALWVYSKVENRIIYYV